MKHNENKTQKRPFFLQLQECGISTEASSMEAGLSLLDDLGATVRRRRNSRGPSENCCEGLQGPCRIVRLCILGIVVPACLIAIPLYVRFHVLHEQQYPVAYSDVRLIDGRVSTTWCQRQMVHGNASFNAYLMPETPKYNEKHEKVSMVRHMILEDDMKEYWGFYLLPGSQVHIKACSRWPGAALIVIKGHAHLRDCAYIGDNSSEEEDEMMEGEQERLPLPEQKHPKNPESKKTPDLSSSTNKGSTERSKVDEKQQQRSGPDPLVKEGKITIEESQVTSAEALDELLSKVSALGSGGERALKKLAAQLLLKEDAAGQAKAAQESSSAAGDKDQMIAQLLQELLKATGSKFKVQPLKDEVPEEASTRSKRSVEEAELHEKISKLIGEAKSKKVVRRRKRVAALAGELHGKIEPFEDAAFEEGLQPDGIADTRGHISENTTGDRSKEEEWSSFSSSEETLMQCEGLLLYLPLTPRNQCSRPNAAAHMAVTDTYSYTATSSGYYFFVFNSENEIQENLISVEFSLARTTYNTTRRVAQCANTTTCAFPLDFFSNEKVVLEVPVAPGREGPAEVNGSEDSMAKHWNEEYLIVSTCEPRTSLYLVCMLLVPVLILAFAFQ